MSLSRDPRVLVVEDDEEIAQVLQRSLRMEGYDVRVAGDGEAALEQAATFNPDLVVLDLGLGPASGLELIPALCQRGLRVVVYSMHDEPTIVRRALAAGAAGYVTKGEAAQSLIEAIRTVLAGRNYLSPRAADALAPAVADPEHSPATMGSE